MIIVPHEQLTKQIPTSNRLLCCYRAEEYLYPLFKRAEHGFNQAMLPEALRARILISNSQELELAMMLYL